MKIAVLIKQVPVSNDVSVDPETHTLVRASSEGMINPSDLNAVEAALELKEQTDGQVVVFTMAPQEAEKSLREAMAMGCDEACLITDRCFGGADTIATAKVLAEGIKKFGDFDLVMCGALSADGATGQIGAMVAEYLSIPHITEIQGVEYDPAEEEKIMAVKKYHDKLLKIKSSLPALVTVGFGCNTPRLATLRTMRAAKKKPMTIYTNEDLQMDTSKTGLKGSPTIVIDSFEPEAARKAVMIKGSGKELAEKLKELIEEGEKE